MNSSTLKALGYGLSLYLITASTVPFQDVAGGHAVIVNQAERWSAHSVVEAVGSQHALIANAASGEIKTGSIAPASVINQARFVTSFKTKRADAIPEQVNRAGKGGRVLSPKRRIPAKHFSAGSIFERQSNLFVAPQSRPLEAVAFMRPIDEPKSLMAAAVLDQDLVPTPINRASQPQARKLDEYYLAKAHESGELTHSTLTAYAATGIDISEPFAELLRRPKLLKGDHAWAANPLPRQVFSKKEQRCLASGIYFEARGETEKGMAGVAQVILNRVKNPTYPNTICGVVYQNQHMKNRCQFSFACDGITDRVYSPRHWSLAKKIAKQSTNGKLWDTGIGSATHYHATYVSPRWARTMKRMKKVGLHIFYRTHRGGWS